MARYVLSIDQSTQGTKALLLDEKGDLACVSALPHRQIVDERGWVEHDPAEILRNTFQAVRDVCGKAGVSPADIAVAGISNQRETALVWDRKTGEPVYNAIVWQCSRGAKICEELAATGAEEPVRTRTGLALSPYFSAAKIAWVLRSVPGAREKADNGELCCGTVDTWLLYQLTKLSTFATDYSNAARTQLFNIRELRWDRHLCDLFGIPMECLPRVVDTNAHFGTTDFDGFLPEEIEIRSAIGDSNGALFGQGCLYPGMTKATYGTGSSVMMNIGDKPKESGLVVTSIAWGLDGKIAYVFEGNINYSGAIITWLKDDLKLISSPGETEILARQANPDDRTYLVPAFSGLGAPYWDSEARAALIGMSRTTGRAEVVKAGLEAIAYQITALLRAMEEGSGTPIAQLRADGGATKNGYLMQFQADMSAKPVSIPQHEELSGIGAAYIAGLAAGLYTQEQLFGESSSKEYLPHMSAEERSAKYEGWEHAVEKVLTD